MIQTVLQSTAGTSDIDVLSGTATIAAGSTSTTFTVTPTTDATVEGIEGIKVSVFDGDQMLFQVIKFLLIMVVHLQRQHLSH